MNRIISKIGLISCVMGITIYSLLLSQELGSKSNADENLPISPEDLQRLEGIAKKLRNARDKTYQDSELRDLIAKLELKSAFDESWRELSVNEKERMKQKGPPKVFPSVTEQFELHKEIIFSAEPIPDDVIRYVHTLDDPHEPPKCSTTQETSNFVYIKIHRTASETLAAMFRRFAFMRDLGVALPHGANTKYGLGWPYNLHQSFHRPKSKGNFNVFLDYATFNENYLKTIMPEDTVYIASIREPFEYLKSVAGFFWVLRWSGIDTDLDRGLNIYLHNIKHFDDLYKMAYPENKFRQRKSCVPYGISMVRNNMAGYLGFPRGFPSNDVSDKSGNYTYILEWLNKIRRIFKVVIIKEYLDHSLVMLKRMMCWSIKDIMYQTIGFNSISQYHSVYAKELVDNFNRWSSADTLLYEYFNQTLWKRIERWGAEDFNKELEYYQSTKSRVLDYCMAVKMAKHTQKEFTVEPSEWDGGFVFKARDCKIMFDDLRAILIEQYEEQLLARNSSAKYVDQSYQVPGC